MQTDALSQDVIIEPRYVGVGQLYFEKSHFFVSKYQRGYAWEGENIEDFWRDIERCYVARTDSTRKEHFFGGLVCVERRRPGAAWHDYEVVDGQQRLATFSILGAVLLSMSRKHLQKAKSEGHPSESLLAKRCDRLEEQFIRHDSEENRRSVKVERLALSAVDKAYFNSILNDTASPPADRRQSHLRLWQAHQTLRQHLESTLDGLAFDEQMDAIKHFEDLINKDCAVIHIKTFRTQDAFRLFQVLNDRGVTLSAGDLLRARSLELLDAPSVQPHQPSAEIVWDDILADPPASTDKYLNWYFSAHKGKRPKQANLFDDFVDEFYPATEASQVDQKLATQLVERLEDLRKSVGTMRRFLDGDWPYPLASTTQNLWIRGRVSLLIRELGHTNCVPLLLAASRLNEKKFAQVLSMVERFAFRYKIICNQHIGRASRVYHEEALSIVHQGNAYKTSSLKKKLSQLLKDHAPDALFKQLVAQQTFSKAGGNKPLKYLLVTLDDYWTWYLGGAKGRPKVGDETRVWDFANTTIEHIYPQKADPSYAASKLESSKQSLANLTILSPKHNDKGGNKNPTDKLKDFAKTSSSMNTDLAKLSSWDEKTHKVREGKLAELAVLIFSL